jgi:Holliday junction DNA helicase RuvA
MIGFLRGVLVAKKPPSLLLDVRGVGYEVDAPMSTFYKLPEVGGEVFLYTHLAIREDAHSLFGFVSESERALFRTLIKVNGVGAKLALAILSGLTAEEFQRAVEYQDTARLVRLPGVGKKTAERLIIELRDRLPELGTVTLPGASTLPMPAASPADDAVSALIALGFKPPEAGALVRKVPAEGKSSEEIIRLALQSAAK